MLQWDLMQLTYNELQRVWAPFEQKMSETNFQLKNRKKFLFSISHLYIEVYTLVDWYQIRQSNSKIYTFLMNK